MILTETDITFSPERDGYPGVAIAFVIDNEVVYTKSFKPSFANDYLLSSPSFSLGEAENVVNITANNNSVAISINEMMTAILLSEPSIIQLTLQNGKHVTEGWKYENDKFFNTALVGGVMKTYYGDGSSD